MFSTLTRNFLLLFVLYNAGGTKIFEGIPKQFECKNYDSDVISNLTCSYKPLGWKKAKCNFNAYIKEGMEINDLVIKGTAYRRESNREYRVFGPKGITVNLCKFLNGSWTHIMVDLIAACIKKTCKSNNVFHPCPFSVDEIYYKMYSGHVYLHDVVVDENAYSAVNFLPDGFYRVFTNQSNEEHLLMEAKSYVELVPVRVHSK